MIILNTSDLQPYARRKASSIPDHKGAPERGLLIPSVWPQIVAFFFSRLNHRKEKKQGLRPRSFYQVRPVGMGRPATQLDVYQGAEPAFFHGGCTEVPIQRVSLYFCDNIQNLCQFCYGRGWLATKSTPPPEIRPALCVITLTNREMTF